MQIYTNIWWSLLDWVEKPLESTVSDKSWFPFVRDFSQSEGTLTFSHHQTYWNKIWNFLERKINFANEYKYKWRENDNSWKFGTGEDNPYHPDLNPEPQPLLWVPLKIDRIIMGQYFRQWWTLFWQFLSCRAKMSKHMTQINADQLRHILGLSFGQ